MSLTGMVSQNKKERATGFLYYYYNQFLESILTAERWASAHDLQHRPHSFLSSPHLEGGKAVLSGLKARFGKEEVKYIILLKEDRAKRPNKWPAPLQSVGSQDEREVMIAMHAGIVAHLLHNESAQVQLRESSTLFPLPQHSGFAPPVVVEDVRIFDQVVKDVTVEVVPTISELPGKKTVDYDQIHRCFLEKKKSSMEIDENGEILLKSSFSFHDYQISAEMREIALRLEHVFQNVEDICLNYGEILRDLDAQIEDELHYIEFFDLDASRCVKAYKRLQELRVKRRCIKDSMQLADLFVKQLGTDLPQRLNHVSDRINHWDKRIYTVRVPEEFKH